MPEKGTITVPLDGLTFPQRCVNCGGPAEGTTGISASKGVFLPFVFLNYFQWSSRRLRVPVDRVCRRRRRAFGFLAYLVCLVLMAAAAAAALQWSGGVSGWLGGGPFAWVRIGLVLVPVLACVNLVVFRLPRLLDAWLLGVRVVSISISRGVVTLRFRDPGFAEEVARLTRTRSADWRWN